MAVRFEATASQTKFLLSQARVVGFVGGIGSGKTAVGAVKAAQKINDGDGIVVGPNFPHFAKSTWEQLRKWFPWSRVVNGHLNHPYTQSKVLLVQTPNGIHKIYYGGIENPESWTGPTVNWFWFDEARRKDTRKEFDVLLGRIRTGPNPQGYVTTSPRGRIQGSTHWLYDVFVEQNFPPEVLELFAKENRPLVEHIEASTEENKTNLDPMYVATLRALYTGAYAEQELEGKFKVFEGLVLSNLSEENFTEQAEFNPDLPVYWGVDDGFTKGHPRVILFAQIDPPYINIFDEHVSTYEVAEESIRRALDKGYPTPMVARVDSAAAEFRARLWDLGIETSAGSHDVLEGVKHLRAMVRDGTGQVHLRFHPRCEFSIGEIQAYCYPDTVDGKFSANDPRAAKPQKHSDNVADAARYLTWPEEVTELTRMAKKRRANPNTDLNQLLNTRIVRLPGAPRSDPAPVDSDAPTGGEPGDNAYAPVMWPPRRQTRPYSVLGSAEDATRREQLRKRVPQRPHYW